MSKNKTKDVMMLPASKAKIKANAKYTEKAYDKFLTYVPKGQKAELQAHAAEQGESLNSFVNKAIMEKIDRDKKPPSE